MPMAMSQPKHRSKCTQHMHGASPLEPEMTELGAVWLAVTSSNLPPSPKTVHHPPEFLFPFFWQDPMSSP
ncbi:hypothetical protein E2C01_096326 [Portunus trituberculatus]|uniref:Uncharacterized protein n=1 Tax=Portunus trituberculatus TaxID=210409 RepID=A0A5B7K1R0_PORTR|nr:hypothetical protein [Portunus trituberculatus]